MHARNRCEGAKMMEVLGFCEWWNATYCSCITDLRLSIIGANVKQRRMMFEIKCYKRDIGVIIIVRIRNRDIRKVS